MKNSRAIQLILTVTITFYSATHANAKDIKENLKTTYQVMQTASCALGITAEQGSSFRAEKDSGHLSVFSGRPTPKAGELIIFLDCVKENAETYCTDTWNAPLRDEDPTTLKIINVRHYDSQHPQYYSRAYVSSTNAVNPPRPRTLYFCLGNESLSVTGTVQIGTERYQTPRKALAIINTLTILPPTN